MVGYAAKIILLRLYPKEAFGMFGFIIAVVTVFMPVVSLRYEDALMLSKDERDGAHSFLLASSLTIILSASLWLLLPFRENIASLYDIPEVADWLWVVPLILIVNRLAKISELWLTRKEAFGRISAGQVVNSTSMVSVRIGAGILSNSPAGLIFGFVAGHAAALLLYASKLRSSVGSALAGEFSMERIRYLVKRYRRFPAFTMPAATIAALASQLPALLLLYYFDMATLGSYTQAYSVLFIPLSLLGGAMAQVFFVRAVEARRNHSLDHVTDTIHKRMVLLAWFPVMALAIAGPDVFQFLFGGQWREAGVMVQYISPWIFLTAVASPLTRLFDVLERQRLELLVSALMFTVMAIALVIGGSTNNIFTTLLFLTAGGSLVRSGQILLLLRLSGVRASRMLWPYVQYAVLSIPSAAMIIAAVIWASPFIVCLAVALAGAAFSAIVVWKEDLLSLKSSVQPSER